MHEVSLLENVREILAEHALTQHFQRVTKVTLEIGTLACIEAEALRFGFDVVMKGSLAENAELIITELPGIGLCRACHEQVLMDTLYDPCPACGSTSIDLLQGAEMKIKDLCVI